MKVSLSLEGKYYYRPLVTHFMAAARIMIFIEIVAHKTD